MKKNQNLASKKSGGGDYVTPVQQILTKLISQKKHFSVECLSTVEIDYAYFRPLMKEVKEKIDWKPWYRFHWDAEKDFSKIEIDLILKISLKGGVENESSLFIPYDMKSKKVGYELDLSNGPIILYIAVTHNSAQLPRDLWQVEKYIALHKILMKIL